MFCWEAFAAGKKDRFGIPDIKTVNAGQAMDFLADTFERGDVSERKIGKAGACLEKFRL